VRIHLLRSQGAIYSAQAYLVLGEWNRLNDVNALVDVGTDGSIVRMISVLSTGVGKKPIERVVLTHTHFDHAGGLSVIQAAYHPETYAYAMGEGIGHQLSHGEVLKLGDEDFEVLHVPEHSSDSVCLYSHATGVLFSGDTPLRMNTQGRSCGTDYLDFLQDLVRRGVTAIYSGHDQPVLERASSVIETALRNAVQVAC